MIYAEHVRRIHALGQGKVRHDVFLFAGGSITAADSYTNTLGQWLACGIPVRRGVGTVPILATIPPRGYDKDKQEGQVRFNKALTELCLAKKVPVSYCFEEMMQRDLRQMLGDGVHLRPQDGNDAAGEALWRTMQQVYFALRDRGGS